MTTHPMAARTMQTSGRPVWRVIVLVAVLTGAAAAADGERPQADAAAAGRLVQERARRMAQELVAGVLDVQVRQLEENGLANRPIHAEITAMRGNIDALVNREMQEVVVLLSKAETATAEERATLVKDARALVRGIVARLSMERQQILRRLRVADIAAQVRRLIGRQKEVATTTDSLPRQPDGKRESLTLAAIEDQRTVKTLYDTFAIALEDVSGWGGSVGSGAVTGLRTLKESQVLTALAAAEGSLGTLDFGGAVMAQRRVIAAFEAVLATLERSRGAGSGNMAASLETLRSLTERGAQLRRMHSTTAAEAHAPLRMRRPVPSSVTGTTGTFSLAATVKAPFLNSASLPLALRVPCRCRAQRVSTRVETGWVSGREKCTSGKNSTGALLRSSSRHAFRHSCSRNRESQSAGRRVPRVLIWPHSPSGCAGPCASAARGPSGTCSTR